MLKQLTVLLLLGISFSCFAQRPLPIEELQPIIDSVKNEANKLLAYEFSTKSALQLAQKRKLIFNDLFTYQSGDSTFVLFLTQEKECKLEYLFLTNYKKPRATSTRLRNLNQREFKLYQLQKDLMQKAEVLSEDSIKAEEEFPLHTILIPSEKEYHLYYITATEQDSIYPSGNDYLFTFNQNLELIRQTYLTFHPINIKKGAQKIGSEPVKKIHYYLSLKGGLLPLATYICKFRLYHKSIGIDKFSVNWNRRRLTYDVVADKVQIHLFYNEKISPKYRK